MMRRRFLSPQPQFAKQCTDNDLKQHGPFRVRKAVSRVLAAGSRMPRVSFCSTYDFVRRDSFFLRPRLRHRLPEKSGATPGFFILFVGGCEDLEDKS